MLYKITDKNFNKSSWQDKDKILWYATKGKKNPSPSYKELNMNIETIKQMANGTWVVVLENGKTFSGINKQDVIDFANEWMGKQ